MQESASGSGSGSGRIGPFSFWSRKQRCFRLSREPSRRQGDLRERDGSIQLNSTPWYPFNSFQMVASRALGWPSPSHAMPCHIPMPCPRGGSSGLDLPSSQVPNCRLRVNGWLHTRCRESADRRHSSRAEMRGQSPKAQTSIAGSSKARFQQKHRRGCFVNGEHRASSIGENACGLGLASILLQESPHLGKQTARGSSEAPIPRSVHHQHPSSLRSERSIDRRLSSMPILSLLSLG